MMVEAANGHSHAAHYQRFDGKAIGVRVRDERKRQKLSLQAVGDAAGFSKGHMWELERGNISNPSMAMMLGLSEALNISVERMLFGEDAGKWGPFRSKFERLSERDTRIILNLMDDMLRGEKQ